MQLNKLKEKVLKRGNIHPYTFYSYLSDMIDIQKNEIPDSRSILVTLVDDGDENRETKDVWDSKFTYDIAISYAGNERKYAEEVANNLRGAGLKVFYDRNQLPDLIGRNLLDELMEIYRDKALLCVILASNAYNSSAYAQWERKAAQDRRLRDPGYIFLVRLENIPIKGFLSSDAFLDWNQYELDKIIELAIQQLEKQRQFKT